MNKTSLKLFVAMMALGLAARAQEESPDFKKEERFHSIYKKYMEQPTSAEAWEKVLSSRSARTYSIQNKDTLWDISSTLFGDSNYWPKIWSYNTEGILNPHEINPNQAIKFYPGTLAEAPTIGVAEKTAAPEALPDQIIEKNEQGTVESIQIPPPKRVSHPVVKKLPPSLPLYRLGRVNEPPVQFQKGLDRPVPPLTKFLSYYVTESAVTTIGEIVQLEGGEADIVGDYQSIVIRLTDPSKKNLLAFRDSQKISDPAGGGKGTIVEVQGEIEVQDKVNDGENLYRAIVKKAINAMEIGAKLTAGTLQTFEIGTKTISTAASQARILGGQYDRYDHRMFSEDDFVFLSAGSREGFQVGTALNVFSNERMRNPKTRIIMNDRLLGQVKLVKVSDHFSTGYVVHAENDIMVGDYVGSGNAVAGTAPSSSGSFDSSSDPDLDLDGATSSTSGSGLDIEDPAASAPAAPQAEPAAPSAGDDDLSL